MGRIDGSVTKIIIISIPQFNDKIQTEKYEWLYVMKHEEVKPEFKSPYMRKLVERLDVLRMNTIERNEYYHYIMQVVTYNNAIDTSEARGVIKGREEERIIMARKMLAKGKAIDEIIEFTELTKEQIQKLK